MVLRPVDQLKVDFRVWHTNIECSGAGQRYEGYDKLSCKNWKGRGLCLLLTVSSPIALPAEIFERLGAFFAQFCHLLEACCRCGTFRAGSWSNLKERTKDFGCAGLVVGTSFVNMPVKYVRYFLGIFVPSAVFGEEIPEVEDLEKVIQELKQDINDYKDEIEAHKNERMDASLLIARAAQLGLGDAAAEKLKANKEAIQKELDDLTEERDSLITDVRELTQEAVTLNQKLKDTEADRDTYKEVFDEMQSKIAKKLPTTPSSKTVETTKETIKEKVEKTVEKIEEKLEKSVEKEDEELNEIVDKQNEENPDHSKIVDLIIEQPKESAKTSSKKKLWPPGSNKEAVV